MDTVGRHEVPDWITLDDDEEPVGFLSDDQGTALLELLMDDWVASLPESADKAAFSAFQDQLSPLSRNPAGVIPPCSYAPRTDKFPPDKLAGTALDAARTFTLYKSAAKKSRPVDSDYSDGSVPEGNLHWKPDREAKARAKMKFGTEFDDWVLPRFNDLPAGTRLTDSRKEAMLATISDNLTPAERRLFGICISNREAALAWSFPECGRIHPDIFPPQEIKTVPHHAWQAKHVPIPKALMPKVIEILEQRLKRGILEESHAPYRNNWFLTQKKDGGLRLINDAQRYNKFTVRDAFIPPNAEEFSEEFGGNFLVSLLDLFSGYDECTLDDRSRDITTFSTPLGLLRMCTLPMGATNSVAQFMRAMTRLFYDLIPHVCRPFLDDICVKSARHDYSGEEVLPGIRRVVAEHIRNLDQILFNCELAGATVSAEKSQWCCKQAVLLGYLCTPDGRLPAQSKVEKITEWRTCTDLTNLRAFLGLAGFYRLWAPYFGIIAHPLYDLTRKNVAWVWTENHQWAMEHLARLITTAPCLAPLEYGDGTGAIYLMVDASLHGWGAVLEQVGPDGKRHPCRFESGIWSAAEKRYDATKRELRGLLYALRRMRRYLYGVHFFVETDAQVLIHQINGSASDIPGALLLRWIAWIRLFDFEIRHIPGSKNGAADGLSRKPAGPSDLSDKALEEDIDDWIDAKMYSQELSEVLDGAYHGYRKPLPSEGSDDIWDERNTWSLDSINIAFYLSTGTYPASIKTKADRLSFRMRAHKHILLHKALFLRPSHASAQPRRIVDNAADRMRIWEACHAECGHRGRESTYYRVTASYYWKGMYTWVEHKCRTCEPCQRHGVKRFEDGAMHSIPRSQPFWKINVDIQYIPTRRGTRPLIEARDDLTNFLVARILSNTKSATVAHFFLHEIILQYGLPVEVLVDGGSELKGEVDALLGSFNIKRIEISPYNSRANGINEAGHFPLAQGLAKLVQTTKKDAYDLIDHLVWADRTSVRQSHGFTPFYLLHGFHPVSEIELDVPTWRLVNWRAMDELPADATKAERRHKLLELRIQALDSTGHLFDVAQDRVAHVREARAIQRNSAQSHRLRPDNAPVRAGDFVLCYDASHKVDRSTVLKAKYRWQGPYVVRQILDKGSYLLRTLDGVDLERPFSTDRVKRFWMDDEDVVVLEDDPDSPPADDSPPPNPPPDAPSPARETRSSTRLRIIKDPQLPASISVELPELPAAWRQEFQTTLSRIDDPSTNFSNEPQSPAQPGAPPTTSAPDNVPLPEPDAETLPPRPGTPMPAPEASPFADSSSTPPFDIRADFEAWLRTYKREWIPLPTRISMQRRRALQTSMHPPIQETPSTTDEHPQIASPDSSARPDVLDTPSRRPMVGQVHETPPLVPFPATASTSARQDDSKRQAGPADSDTAGHSTSSS